MAKAKFISNNETRKILEIAARDPSMRAKEVLARLTSELPEGHRVLSLRSIQRALTKFSLASGSLEEREWAVHLMPGLAVPGFALPVLTRLSRIQEGAGAVLTCRDAKWAWYVKSAAPELQDRDVLSIATQYSFEEWVYNVLGEKLGSDDDLMVLFLDKLLTYQPWTSEKNRQEFVSAIPDRIPFPSESLSWSTWAYCLGAPAPKEFTFSFDSPEQVPAMPPPRLHPTKAWFRDMEIIWGAHVA